MLRDPEATTSVERADAALCKFAIALNRFCRNEKALAKRSHSLTFAKGVLSAPHEWTHEGKVAEGLDLYISSIAVELIDGELDVLQLEVEFPERFCEAPTDRPPLAQWNGKIIELIEYHMPLQISGIISMPSGAEMTYADLIRFLEAIYGITISNAHDRKSEVVSRAKPTTFIEKMLTALKNSIKKLHQ